MSWKCFGARCPTPVIPCLSLIDWQTGSPKSLPNSANSAPHRSGQRLAGYAELGITGLMPSTGLCREKEKAIALEQ
jgi:hypothetical protein